MTQTAEQTPQADDSLYNTFSTGTYKEVTDEGFVFDLPQGAQALVERDEFPDGPPFEPGDEVDLIVEQPVGERWSASARKAEQLRFWDEIEEMAGSKKVVEGDIVAANKGGLSVDIGLRAFCPKSHIDLHRVKDASPYVGRHDEFRIIQFDKDRCNVVVSRREVLEKRRKEERAQTIEEVEEGKVFTGVVRNIKKYGAFVDIGGIDGLLHISNMSWGRIDHPSELVRPGDEVKVIVLDYDKDRDRLSLGRKQLLDDPWTDIDQTYTEGQTAEGEVVSLADFGAFIEIAPGLEGLVHVTELSWTRRIHHPREVLDLGQKVRVKIIGIDSEKRRLSLSVKQLEQNPWDELAEGLEVGEVVSGPIRNITDFGLFVEVAPSIEGLVHVSDFSWTDKIDDPNEHYRVGEEVEAKVLEIDVDNQRLGLGIKQLSRDPWAKAKEIAKPGEKIKVTITRLTDFGAFAQVIEGVEGLIHISELAEERVENVHSVVRPGQEIEALVVSFDRANQRIGLSLKRDELGAESNAREYIEEDGATAKLGDILRDRLGLGEEEQQEEKSEEEEEEVAEEEQQEEKSEEKEEEVAEEEAEEQEEDSEEEEAAEKEEAAEQEEAEEQEEESEEQEEEAAEKEADEQEEEATEQEEESEEKEEEAAEEEQQQEESAEQEELFGDGDDAEEEGAEEEEEEKDEQG
jgi:small subunit ribosomal protein S1